MSPATSVLKQPDDYFYSKTRCSRLINNYARNIAISFNDTIRLEASSQQVPVLPRSQVLDLCNKSVAIYDIAPNDRGTNAITLHDYIYRLWVNDWETDIEFGRFPAKYIRVSSDTREGMPSVQRILDLHNALCKQAQCSDDDFDKLEETVTGGSRHSKLHRQYYGLEPVFQSLIIVIEDNATNVKTKTAPHLKTSISFDTIPGSKTVSADGNEATTKLSSALKFVIALDERESGHQLIDATYAAYDPCLGDPVGAAKRDGYDDSEVRRTPSHRWLKPGAKIVPGPPKHRGRSSYPPEQYDAEA